MGDTFDAFLAGLRVLINTVKIVNNAAITNSIGDADACKLAVEYS